MGFESILSSSHSIIRTLASLFFKGHIILLDSLDCSAGTMNYRDSILKKEKKRHHIICLAMESYINNVIENFFSRDPIREEQ